MRGLRYRLPPPNSLVTFEAVARHLGFTAAARELGVSQAATSRQIRNLESYLELKLFRRLGRGVELTRAGTELYGAVGMGLGHIASTVESLRRQRDTSYLTVASTVAFSSLWLMPRLGRFHAAHPDCELRLVSSDRDSDWRADDTDILLVYGTGSWPGFRARRLFDEEIFAVAAPGYFSERSMPDSVAALANESLLHTEAAESSWLTWRDWFARVGVKAARGLGGPLFSTYTLTILAALEGRGLALGWRRLLTRELDDGRLIAVTDAMVVPDEGYHVLIANRLEADPRAAAFRDWILREARQEE